jgi:hypothetical protein
MANKFEGIDEFTDNLLQPKLGSKVYHDTLYGTAQKFANRSIWSKNRITELTDTLDSLSSSATKIYYLAGVPNDGFGENGSLYVDSGTFNIYVKDSGSWILIVDQDKISNKLESVNNVTPVDKNIDILVGAGLEIDNTVDGQISLSLYETPVASLSGGSTNEIGASLTNINLTWTYNKTEVSQSINQGLGAQAIGNRAVVDPATITANTTYTLTIDDGTTEITSNTSVSFKNKSHWGTSALTSLSSAQILTLADKAFSTNKNLSFSIDGVGEYIYVSYPASYGIATFNVNGLLNTAWTLAVVSHTNAEGHVENYNVYRTNTVQNGTDILVEVS